MNLQEHYDNLWEKSISKFEQGEFELDSLIDSSQDNRFGITVVIRPGKRVVESIEQMLQEIKILEPAQYYYPSSDIHITVLSVISCYQGFSLEKIQPEAYKQIIEEVCSNIGSFDIYFKGITASPSCVMVQGFPADDSLKQLRDQLRKRFKSSGLQQTIDTRYTIQTAHCTVLRFRTEMANPQAFLDKLEEYRMHYFGTSSVEEVELVYNDWYQRKELVQQLGVFPL